jgi:putative transcriptional regulator
MMPSHHLDPATVVSHSAGALSPEMAAVVATHLQACAACRASLAQADQVGGLLVAQRQPDQPAAQGAMRLRDDVLARLDGLAQLPAAAGTPATPPNPAAHPDPDRIPLPLQPYFGASYSGLKWRWMGPGMHYIRRVGPTGGTLLMLRIGAGKRMPVHGHGGAEITQILSGAYDDALGHFAAGDVADLDAETEHQPVTSAQAPCICVSALEAPLRFPGWFARRLQPVFGI